MTSLENELDLEAIAKVRLSARQESQIVELCSAITLTMSNPRSNVRAMNVLVRLGFAIEIRAHGERAWQITPRGRVRCTSIY